MLLCPIMSLPMSKAKLRPWLQLNVQFVFEVLLTDYFLIIVRTLPALDADLSVIPDMLKYVILCQGLFSRGLALYQFFSFFAFFF